MKIWYFVNNCLIKKIESKNPFAHVWHLSLWLSVARYISFLLNRFSVKYGFPFQILSFLPSNHLALLKDRSLEKMLLKRVKTRRLFSPANYRLK